MTTRTLKELVDEAATAIRSACTMCNGEGQIVGTRTIYGHACDGTEESCQASCPVNLGILKLIEEITTNKGMI